MLTRLVLIFSLTWCICLPKAAQGQTLNDGLVAYYPLDGNAVDASGNGYDGQVVNAGPGEGRLGDFSGSMAFDGFTDNSKDRIELPTLLIGGSVTVSFWHIYTGESALGPTKNQVVFMNDIHDNGWSIYISNFFGYPEFNIHTVTQQYKINQSNVDVSSNAGWHHFALVYDQPGGLLSAFIDGQLVGSTSASGTLRAPVSGLGHIGMGNPNWSDPSYLNGRVDDLRIYDRPLSATEVLTLYYETTNTPPIADAGMDQYVVCEGVSGASVTLDGSASSDPNGDPLTFTWMDPAGQVVGTGPTPSVLLSQGVHPITLTVDDGKTGVNSDEVLITVSAGTGTVSGVITQNSAGLPDQTVKLLDDATPTIVVAEQTTDPQGGFLFSDIPEGTYQIMVVEPLGYVSDQNFVPVFLTCGGLENIAIALTPIQIVNQARGKGYWKHQFDVYVNGKGSAQETAEALESYIAEVESRYSNPHFQTIFAGMADGDNDFGEWQDVLSVKGNAGMAAKAKAHLAALTLNIMALKIGQSTVVTTDGYTAGDVLTYASELLTDNDPANDATAKDLAELVNEQQTIGAGLVHPSSSILYKMAEGQMDQLDSHLPTSFALEQNYPNPFNPSTVISYALPETAYVRLTVYDLQGQVVARLQNGLQEAGTYRATWQAEGIASGVYLYRLQAGAFNETRRLTLVR